MGMLLRRREVVNKPLKVKVEVDNTKATETLNKATESKPKAQKKAKK